MRKLSDASALLRVAIEEVLSNATEPMTSTEIGQKPVVFELGVEPLRIQQVLYQLYKRKSKVFPIKRTPSPGGRGSGRGAARWGYYNPNVVKMALPPRPEPTPAPEPVNAVNPPAFEFNPVSLEQADVSLPADVKSITLTIGGVTIKIEVNQGGAQ